MNASSQSKAILQALLAGDALTAEDARRRFGTMRLAARISDIRDGKADGKKYDKDTIRSDLVRQNGKSFARYRYVSPRLQIIESIPAFKPVEPKPEEANKLF